MPDTGAPWNIPYVASTDLVSDWPADSLALANAIDSGLDAAGGLVAVKHAILTATQTENSVSAGASFAVDNLSITHTLADASNKLIIHAYLGAAAEGGNTGRVGIAVLDGATKIGVGAAAGSRSQVGAGGRVTASSDAEVVTMPSVTFVYEPGDTSSHTYTVHAVLIQSGTQNVYINRAPSDTDTTQRPRAASAFVIQEVKV